MPLSFRGRITANSFALPVVSEVRTVTELSRVITRVPEMTSNTAPSGTVTASSYVNSSYINIWKAFRNSYVDAYDCWAAASATNEWLKYDAGAGNTLDASAYSIARRYAGTDSPKTWTFEGSDDDTNWDVLDSQTDILLTGWGISQEKCFSLGQIHSYRYYRLNVAAANGSYIVVGRLAIGYLRDLATSAMTSANTPSPEVVSSSSNGGATVVPWYAVRHRLIGTVDDGSGYCWISENTTPVSVANPEWIKHDAGPGNANTLTHYRFTARLGSSSQAEGPKDFILQGSNDDSAWTDLHSATGLALSAARTYSPTYEVSSPQAFRYHRLLVTDSTAASSARVAMSLFELLK